MNTAATILCRIFSRLMTNHSPIEHNETFYFSKLSQSIRTDGTSIGSTATVSEALPFLYTPREESG